jgi:AraC family transcriptional regulator
MASFDPLARMQADFESAWPSSRVARDAGLSAPHAAREFRRHTGRGIGEHVRRLRLAHARTLLAGSEPVATIAARAGFCDQSHLTRCFRAAFGVTPEHYRRSVRAGSIQTAPDLF